MNHKPLFALFSLFLLLAACTSVEPTPTPTAVAAVEQRHSFTPSSPGPTLPKRRLRN
ncbi:MAG: hypothetical protein KJ069_22000 [Anaerolineae bacterium]|nr:hypothetical protein [Anaerolineae bacterium]